MKKSNLKRLLSLLLALVMVLSLAGCSQRGETTTEAEKTKQTTKESAAKESTKESAKESAKASTEVSTEESKSASGGSSAEDILARDFSEHIEISFAGIQVNEVLNYTDDNDYYKMWSDRFNISFDVTGLSSESFVERMNTWINADDLPDWSVWKFNSGDAINYAEQGLVKKMPDDWREKYPNLAAASEWCEANAYYEELLGGMYYFFRPTFAVNFPAENITNHTSIWLRTDWAEEAGYDLSKNLKSNSITLSEFIAYCQAVKDAGICEYPWYNTSLVVGQVLGSVTDHDGTIGNVYYLGDDGQYHWGPAEEGSGIKAALKQIKEAYDSGLLYKEFYTLNDQDDKGHFYAKGDCAGLFSEGMAYWMDEFASEMETNLGIDFWDKAVTLVLTDDNGIAHGDPSKNFWNCNIISPNISDEKLDRILTLWDYCCTEQGQLEIRLGIEGVDWKKNDDGTVTNLLADTEYGSVDKKYTDIFPIYGNMFVLSDDFSFVNPSYSKEARDRVAILYKTRSDCFSAKDVPVNWKLASFRSQEMSLASMTYASEYANLITKDGDFDTNYDKWIEEKMSLIQPVLDGMNAKLCN